MPKPSRYAQFVTAFDRGLPRPLTVGRQQSVYWPSVWGRAIRHVMGGSLCINGFPSSGTNWLCHRASRYFGALIFEPWTHLIRDVRRHVCHLHHLVDAAVAQARTLYNVRDGRDALVSRYMRLSPNPNDQRPARAFKQVTSPICQKENAREQLLASIGWYFTETRFSSMNWACHIRSAIDMDLPRLTFKNLKRAPVETLEPLFARVSGQPVIRTRLEKVVEEMEFSRIRNDESAHHLRKSQVGEWRSLFTRNAREVFGRHAQDALEAMGYERDRGWIETELEKIDQ